MKLAFADREAYFGDPRMVDVPIEALLSREYARQRREHDPPGSGLARNAAGRRSAQARRRARAAAARALVPERAFSAPELDTSHVCVIDRHGNVFAATPSDGSYNAPVIPELGIIPSPRGSQNWGDPDHPSGVAPGKRPRLTPSPAIAIAARQDEDAVRHARRRRADPGDAAGVPQHPPVRHGGAGGGRGAARARPTASRRRSSRTPIIRACSTWRAGSTSATGEALGRLGHKIEWWPDWTWLAGAVCTVVADQETGVLKGGADPRRPSYALGLVTGAQISRSGRGGHVTSALLLAAAILLVCAATSAGAELSEPADPSDLAIRGGRRQRRAGPRRRSKARRSPGRLPSSSRTGRAPAR